MELIYIRNKSAKLLKDCWVHRRHDNWCRTLQRNVGYEILDSKKVIATIYKGKARPVDGQESRSNKEIENYCKQFSLKLDISGCWKEDDGLFFVNGLYRTWAERNKITPIRL